MNQGAKQRIVGTVVLLALALIFLPIIFDGQGSYQPPISSRIPDTPVIAIVPEPIQSRPVIVGAVDAPEQETTTEEEPATEEIAAASDAGTDSQATEEPDDVVEITESQAIFSREVPQLSDAGLPQGWSVRLGSFSDAQNASTLVSRLQEAGYKAYTRAIPSNQGSLTGVFVGPWLDRGQVNEYQQKLQEEFALAGLVVRYELERL
ncbi:MAG: SPOR domain-containing protein [Pseudohongiellaceae bacterium]